MEKSKVSKLTKLSKNYIHKIDKGQYDNDTSKLVQTLMSFNLDKMLIELLIDDMTYDICEIAIAKAGKRTHLIKHAYQIQQLREVVLKTLDKEESK